MDRRRSFARSLAAKEPKLIREGARPGSASISSASFGGTRPRQKHAAETPHTTPGGGGGSLCSLPSLLHVTGGVFPGWGIAIHGRPPEHACERSRASSGGARRDSGRRRRGATPLVLTSRCSWPRIDLAVDADAAPCLRTPSLRRVSSALASACCSAALCCPDLAARSASSSCAFLRRLVTSSISAKPCAAPAIVHHQRRARCPLCEPRLRGL